MDHTKNLCSLKYFASFDTFIDKKYGEIVAGMNFEPKFDLWKSNLDWASQSVSGLKLQKFRAYVYAQTIKRRDKFFNKQD